jgi:RNA polymerase sigma-70 factor (ECF subfamily)
MERYDWTEMGGVREKFLTTHWSLIEDIQNDPGGDRETALIGLLLERYWKPVYCYLRRKGYGNEHAKDLTQGFFHDVVLNRNLVQRVDPCKGRFRTFLLHALSQYLIDQQRKEAGQKHIPPTKLTSLDLADPPAGLENLCEMNAEQSFDYVWKAQLLEQVVAEVRERYLERGMETHWNVFRDRLLEPVLEDREAPSLPEICRRYGIDNEATASAMIKTVKRFFRNVLTEHVRQTVVSGQTAEEELQEIFQFSGKKRAE